jgi:hypothetical protein
MQAVAEAMAKQANKKYNKHNLNTVESLFSQEKLDKLQDVKPKEI